MPTNIRIVLIETSHPGNIGSAARAMKTMGLERLYLVAPLKFPDPKANELASNAADLLDKAIVVKNLEEAIADCHLVVGTSSRERAIPWPLISSRELGEKIQQESLEHEIAILFGPEQTGLTNEDLQRCHLHIHIPSNPEYCSLNLAQAVQVIAYELRVSLFENKLSAKWDYELADQQAMEGFYRHLEEVLKDLDFLKKEAPRQLMPRLRRLFNRARPDVMEMNILRGILGAVDKLKNSK